MYSYGLVGNCQISALIHESGSLDWLCMPRPDSEPLFGRLLDPDGGHFSIELSESGTISNIQSYIENTNVLLTEIAGSARGRLRVTDFCPRFEQYGRMFRPLTFVRILEPLDQNTFVTIRVRPVSGWSKEPLHPIRGSSHIRYEWGHHVLRLTTNMPMTYLTEETSFHLKERTFFIMTWGSSVEEDIGSVCDRFLSQTINYWRTWVKHCSIPPLFQKEVIRSALCLKLHCYEDTGAILAATTTSLPEELGGTRNWDYRFCWLRDAYFTLTAFHNLGHFEEMEAFLKFLVEMAFQHKASKERLHPVYTLSREMPLPETIHEKWAGFGSSKPVRVNNQAAEHIQNDVYGEMILALVPIYLDERFQHLRTDEFERLMGYLAEKSVRSIGQVDAGLWELRTVMRQHSFTDLMLWAGLERLGRIQAQGLLSRIGVNCADESLRAQKEIQKAVKDGILRSAIESSHVDAALSYICMLRYPDSRLCERTLEEVWKKLSANGPEGGFFYRYLQKDDFGVPQSAFVACSFWVAQALARTGSTDRAIRIIQNALGASNAMGLFSEHFDPSRRLQLGNFPQAYSHVGLINAAFEVSPRWSDVL